MPTRPLSSALWATRTQFAALGLLSGIWGVHIPTIKQQYGLGEAWLSLLLLTVALGAVLSLLVAGRVIARLGVRRATRLAAIRSPKRRCAGSANCTPSKRRSATKPSPYVLPCVSRNRCRNCDRCTTG